MTTKIRVQVVIISVVTGMAKSYLPEKEASIIICGQNETNQNKQNGKM